MRSDLKPHEVKQDGNNNEKKRKIQLRSRHSFNCVCPGGDIENEEPGIPSVENGSLGQAANRKNMEMQANALTNQRSGRHKNEIRVNRRKKAEGEEETRQRGTCEGRGGRGPVEMEEEGEVRGRKGRGTFQDKRRGKRAFRQGVSRGPRDRQTYSR